MTDLYEPAIDWAFECQKGMLVGSDADSGIPFAVSFFRFEPHGDEVCLAPKVTAFVQSDRTWGRKVLDKTTRVLADATEAEMITFVSDSYGVHGSMDDEKRKKIFEEMRPGFLQEMVDAGRREEFGIVDVLMLAAARRSDHREYMTGRAYERDDAGTFRWLPESEFPQIPEWRDYDPGRNGAMQDLLWESLMETPTTLKDTPLLGGRTALEIADGMGLSTVERQTHQLMAGIRVLAAQLRTHGLQDSVQFMLASTDEESAIVEKSVGRDPFLGMARLTDDEADSE